METIFNLLLGLMTALEDMGSKVNNPPSTWSGDAH
jgi:hypothetical protein